MAKKAGLGPRGKTPAAKGGTTRNPPQTVQLQKPSGATPTVPLHRALRTSGKATRK